MADKRQNRRNPRESAAGKVFLVVFTFFFVLSLGIYLNEEIFKLEFIPTSAELSAMLTGRNTTVTTADGEISVHYINVEQGDCELIVAEDTRVLIDTGEAIFSNRVINYISSLGIRRLDYVIASHPHEDHIGGMADVLEKFTVGKVIMPEIPNSILPMTRNFERMLDVISRKKIDAEYSRTGTIIPLGNGAELQILAPVHDDYSDLNNFSIVCRLVHGENSFLFTGDIERAAENDILNSGEYIRSDVLKVGHHGSTSSSTADFIEAVSPKYAVICVGKDNSYGHPKQAVIDRLTKYGAVILTTMESGNIVFVSDGEKYSIYSDNGEGDFRTEEAA